MAHFISWTVEALKKYPSRPLFKEYVDSNDSPGWISVSYETFLEDLERSAAYWVQNLSELGVKQNDVVGLWLARLTSFVASITDRKPQTSLRITGVKYSDLAHIYGLARAGYIPEVLGASLTIPIIRDLFAKTGGKALLFEPTFANLVTDFELPSLAIPELGALPAVTSPLPPLPDVAPTDPGLIFHTSGTTSGIPKPVPETHRWIKCQAQVLWPKTWQCYSDGRPLILNNIGCVSKSNVF